MKRLLIILSVILVTTSFANAQASRTGNPGEIVVKTYPVPATDHINIELEKANNTNYTLTVYNFLGRKMHEQKNFSQKVRLTLDEYTRGVYIYHLSDVNGRLVRTGKFQVSK